MTNEVVDFENEKLNHLHKRKEAKVDALRRAFRLARGETDASKARKKAKKRRDSGKK